jgi:hypothetical protein
VFNNEIPMRPGFTFDLRPWGAVLVAEEQSAAAREIAADVLTTIHGSSGESASAMPARISLNSRHWVGIGYICLVVFELLGGLAFMVMNVSYYGYSWLSLPFWLQDLEPSNAATLLFIVIFNLVAGIIALALMFLNWERFVPVFLAAVAGMLSLPVVIIYALFCLLRNTFTLARSAFFAILRFAHGRWP